MGGGIIVHLSIICTPCGGDLIAADCLRIVVAGLFNGNLFFVLFSKSSKYFQMKQLNFFGKLINFSRKKRQAVV